MRSAYSRIFYAPGLAINFMSLTRVHAHRKTPKRTLYFAHLFAADHILSTAWTVFFGVTWWIYTPHDGRRVSNSAAQQSLIDGYIGEHQNYTDAQRALAAESIWVREKNQAATIIILGWLSKVCSPFLFQSIARLSVPCRD